MNRDDIKYRLRESLESLYKDEMLGEAKKKKKKDKNDDSDKKNELDQTAIKRELDKPLAPPKIAVCQKALGYDPKDSTDRSRCVKKIDQEDGQHLLQKELDKVAGVVSHIAT